MQRILKRNQRKLPNVDLDVDAYRKDIKATDRLTDRIVYQSYGLTEEEVGVVEGRNR